MLSNDHEAALRNGVTGLDESTPIPKRRFCYHFTLPAKLPYRRNKFAPLALANGYHFPRSATLRAGHVLLDLPATFALGTCVLIVAPRPGRRLTSGSLLLAPFFSVLLPSFAHLFPLRSAFCP